MAHRATLPALLNGFTAFAPLESLALFLPTPSRVSYTARVLAATSAKSSSGSVTKKRFVTCGLDLFERPRRLRDVQCLADHGRPLAETQAHLVRVGCPV